MEAADLPVLRFVLIEECQPGLVEFFEELIPANLLQSFLSGTEVNSEDARVSVLPGLFYGRRHAIAFLERANELRDLFSSDERQREIHVAATQYLILYVLVDAVRRFHQAFPKIHVRLSNHTEQAVEQTVRLADTDLGAGTSDLSAAAS